ncbi:MFS transporter [Ruegeria pomeroyi]|uniref:MFS transporter n=1 Tax=Ruegeria alba TaxID=2916756 RepID=A0ABS9P1Q9_9RHOB|nr:MFS transporter [Ruegeria alba]MCE8511876.1 MFS transporter [Ruegeria pomeroyi]MCE8520467.1 MFS transporter [Ruegeria pomeroyi]MCE8524984.1 MFS transporter [Ruegeria pomeroyi]MCE8528481.1 MFS transporter [Ruegeria pomeroyi]MCE8533103.1 MFS transporter [Ruegeria pomeroyi]
MIYPRVSLYALMLAAAGIPLYIHLPRFASVELGIGLGAIGAILLAIRLVDLVQDPLIGWAIDRWPRAQSLFAVAAALGLAIGFPLLFATQPGSSVVARLLVILVLLFSAYSLGMILLYGRSATLAAEPTPRELMRLAAYREAGMLAGVIVAAIAPAILVTLGAAEQGYGAFGLFLGAIALGTAVLTLPIWRREPLQAERLSLVGLRQAGAMRLLTLALVNSLPVAITSTLFLFFVEDRLQLAGKAGPLLILFFLSAGFSVPFWVWTSQKMGAKATLMIAMPLAILGFVGAAFLAPGNLIGFAAICLASGAALGADMVILPTMFSVALTKAGLEASAAFGIWSFAGKLGLALAAFLTLPLLEFSGFVPGASNSAAALGALNVSYAVFPCLLKLGALALVLALPTENQIA